MATSGQPISVLVVLSSAHEPLFRRYFQPTLPPGLRLQLCELGTNKSDGAYMSEEWQNAMCAKVRHALDFCRLSPEGEPFIVSDVDVQFFPSFKTDEFISILDSLGCDLAFQRERFREGDREANCGFYAGRNTAAVRSLLAAALDNLERDPIKNEQNAVNRLMRETGFPYAMFDRRFYARTHGFPPPRDVWMHHASWTSSIPEKISQIERVRRILFGGSVRLHIESYAEMLARPTAGVSYARFIAGASLQFLTKIPLAAGSLP